MSYLVKYYEKEPIGRGNFGTVYLVTHKLTGENYIAKKIGLTGLNDKEILYSYQEAKVLHSLYHPNIVRYIESFMENNELIIVMEYCEGGDIANKIKHYKDQKMIFPIDKILT